LFVDEIRKHDRLSDYCQKLFWPSNHVVPNANEAVVKARENGEPYGITVVTAAFDRKQDSQANG